RMQRPRIALRWLHTAARQYPGIQPLRDGQPLSVDRWLDDLAAFDGGVQTLPSLQLPIGPARLLDGRLVALPHPSPSHWPRNQIILQQGDALELRRGRSFDRAWRTPLGIDEP